MKMTKNRPGLHEQEEPGQSPVDDGFREGLSDLVIVENGLMKGAELSDGVNSTHKTVNAQLPP